MTCKTAFRQVVGGGSGIAVGTIRLVVGGRVTLGCATAVRQQGGASQVVGQEVEQAVVIGVGVAGNTRGNRLPGQVVGTALDGA